ncbi:MAG: tRNA (adenosine(37)-N6)-threonylcarbamoyltransferase complex dimerization subunit type 1 TsaB [Dehalococcoidales bacterium]|nr:tRNA (adenosine(37)-N6)-threonylcarbamoyltransferase complex dimerization subunit type 1 TsaB [Dehalococcoidales bacterium]
MQIAIDTSTDFAGLAIVRDCDVIAEMTWRCGSNHTVELYPRLDYLLSGSGLDIREADCVYVALGPGAFNGLRVGVGAAKGLALCLRIPIIGISTLESMAYQHASAGLPLCSVQKAGREEIAAAVFQQKPRKGWTRLSAEHITTIEALVSEIREETLFCGDLNPEVRDRIKKSLGRKALFPPFSLKTRTAVFLAELGRRRFLKGDFDNLATLQPIYLRRPHITERKKA